jgi:hypothetical protein
MKFSLREVFDIRTHDDVASRRETSALLESYGLIDSSGDAENKNQLSEDKIDEIHRAVTTLLEGTSPLTEAQEAQPEPTKKTNVNRDDLVLDRWRKMAGL